MSEETIRVRVGRKIYPAYRASDGVLRFKPNRILRRFVDNGGPDTGYDLHRLAIDYARGRYTLEEMIEFYTSIDYSIDGFRDVLDGLLEQAQGDRLNPPQMSVRVLD